MNKISNFLKFFVNNARRPVILIYPVACREGGETYDGPGHPR